MTVDVAEVYKAIGAIGAKLDAVAERLTESERRSADAERRSAENRSKIYEKVEDVSRRTHSLETSTTRLEGAITESNAAFKLWAKEVDDRLDRVEETTRVHSTTFKEIKPALDLVVTWKQRAIGIGIALSVIGFLFGATVMNFRANLAKLLISP